MLDNAGQLSKPDRHSHAKSQRNCFQCHKPGSCIIVAIDIITECLSKSDSSDLSNQLKLASRISVNQPRNLPPIGC